MPERTFLVASNYWHNPGITIRFRHDGDSPKGSIHVEADMEDVIKAVLKEFDSPLKIWTRARLEKSLRSAYTTTLEKIKEATNKVA